MSIADNIKRAALGPEPVAPVWLDAWLPSYPEWMAVEFFVPKRSKYGGGYLRSLTNDERRMFLLFVAYSLGAK